MIRLATRILLGILIAAAVWWIGPLLAIGVYHPLSGRLLRQVLVAIALLWGFWPLLIRWTGRLSLPRARTPRPAPAEPSSSDPIQRRFQDLEIHLRQRWVKGALDWKTRWKLKREAPHRHAQPWFLLLGNAGAGKTTLVRKGGMALDGLAATLGPAAWDEGHTVDCNFWEAGQAVWLDINGHWLDPSGSPSQTETSDWKSWLRALRRADRRPALDGALLCVDALWLLNTSTEGRKRVTDTLRARWIELTEHLELRLPVYVAVTHLDQLPGAPAFLGALDDQELSKGLGFGMPLAHAGSTGSDFRALYDRAVNHLEASVQERILHLGALTAQPQQHAERLLFTESLARLGRLLGEHLERTVAGTELGYAGHVRAVWMGSNVDLLQDHPDTLFLDTGLSSEQDHRIKRLPALWEAPLKQMVRERGMSSSLAPRKPGRHITRHARWAALGLVSTVALLLLGAGYLQERHHIEQVWASFNESKRLAEFQSRDAAPSAAMMDVLHQLRYINHNVENASERVVAPFWEHLRIATASKETYRRHLRKSMMPELYNYVHQTLVSQVNGAPGDIYDTLKIYLMLARPQRRDPEELVRWMATQWERFSSSGYTEEDRPEFEAHLRSVFTVSGIPNTPEDKSLVQEARMKASLLPTIVRVINRIKSEPLPAQIEDVSLSRAGGLLAATTLRMRSELAPTDAAIPGWYTRAGYHDVFKPRLSAAARATLEEESWVLRDDTLSGNSFEIERTVEKLADASRSQFLQEYIKRWQSFLNDVTVRHYAGMNDAAQIASAMMDPQSALAQLVRFSARELSLTGNYQGDVDSWIDRQKYRIEQGRRAVVGQLSGETARNRLLPEHVVEDHFESVRRIGQQLVEATNTDGSSNPLSRLFEPLYRQLSLVNGMALSGQILPEYDAFARLRGDASRQPEPIRGVMLDLITSTSRQVASDSQSAISRNASAPTRLFCDMGLAARYPINRRAGADVAVQNFEQLFGPNGSLSTHFREHLSQYVDTSTSPWQARSVDGATPLVTPDVLRAYEAAHRIGASMLDESGKLRVSTSVSVSDMDAHVGEVVIEFGSQRLRYAHGSMSNVRVDWPGNGNQMVRITVRSVDGRSDFRQYDGPWALFRFFDSGNRRPLGPDRSRTTHTLPLGSVQLEWQALSSPAPLWSNVLQSFSCPR